MFKKVDPKQSLPKLEEEILKYWDENKIFEKSVEKDAPQGEYSFYDGPPFATGTPHYGHIVGTVIKDVVPRYWTMCGYRIERRWGWDCHGLPIENIAEKELGIRHKKDIEALGVAKFNDFCRSKVLEYAAEWEKIIPRLGRWVDMKNAYRTMDRDFMASIWWVFKELWDKGLIYESYRSMHICPRCETTLSQSEVAEGYKDVKDLAVTVKFELVGESGTFVLAWTTTPWTLPGNVALAVNKDIEYVKVKYIRMAPNEEVIKPLERGNVLDHQIHTQEEYVILAKDLFENYKKDFQISEPKIVEEFKGSKLVGRSYKPPFDYYFKDNTLENYANGWRIYAADFVTTDMGTGVAHEAPAFGEEDMELAKKENLPWIQHVKIDGTMKEEVTDFAGQDVKPRGNPQTMDIEIIKYLAKKNLLFAKEKYEHSYPHCWRCDTPLLNYATSSWFVNVLKIKEQALQLAKEINWSPEHMKEGRFGKWLEGAHDWSISRQRYWASVMPIWKCEQCETLRVFGSVTELEKASGQTIPDLHKHIVDEITLPCEKCGREMKRIPDVLDTWFDSGSMPYAQQHYPFENKEGFEKIFPADFIGEGVDMTRAWFYYLHIVATALQGGIAYKNVVAYGIVLAEDGKKMSKRLQNYPDPMLIVNKYGADALRFYLLSSPVISTETINFSEKDLVETSRNIFRMLWNSYSFFVMYASLDKWQPESTELRITNYELRSLLDRWILSELQILVKGVNEAMEKYDLQKAVRLFTPFIDDLSNWYIRRSRKRFWKPARRMEGGNENDEDKNAAYATLHHVLVTLSKLMAPFTPFLAEEMYRNLVVCHSGLSARPAGGDPESQKKNSKILKHPPERTSSVRAGIQDDNLQSVHLADFPVVNEELIDKLLNGQMAQVRMIVSVGLQLRAQVKVKVRQPLGESRIKNQELSEEFLDIVKEELNIKKIIFDGSLESDIVLDTHVTSELKLEGDAREVVRFIQELRKEAGYEVSDRIILFHQGSEDIFAAHGEMIGQEVLATEVRAGAPVDADITKELSLEDKKIQVWLKRIIA